MNKLKQLYEKRGLNWGTIACLVFILSACQMGSPYQRMVKEELASGIRQDSLFLGISLGMSAKDFYAHCWELNRQQIILAGASNLSVLYTLPDLRDTAFMNFYPTFNEEGKIIEMPIVFRYQTWAPWNKGFWSDSLLPEVLTLFEDWYGGREFIEMSHPQKGKAYVKVDGNRRIIVHRKDDQYVKATIVDLTAKETDTQKEGEVPVQK